jgi:hypothetical protein
VWCLINLPEDYKDTTLCHDDQVQLFITVTCSADDVQIHNCFCHRHVLCFADDVIMICRCLRSVINKNQATVAILIQQALMKE